MKYLLVILVLTFIVFSNTCAQERILKKFPVDIEKNGSSFIQTENSNYPIYYLVGTNFTVDNQQNVFVANAFNKCVYKFNNSDNTTIKISLPDVYLYSNQIINIVPEVSLDGTLYALLRTNEESFIGLLVNDGKSLKEIKLDKIPKGRVQRFYINCDSELCFSTFPHAIDPIEMSQGLIFIYNKDGHFLRRTEFPYTTKSYRVKASLTNEKIIIYAVPKEGSDNSKYTFEVKNKNISTGEIALLGTDNDENIYIYNNDEILIQNVISQKQSKIKLSVSDRKIDGLITTARFLRVLPNGSIYMLGIISEEGKVNPNMKVSSDNLEAAILNIK